MIGNEYGELADPVPHAAYDGFTDAIVAPMRWSEGVQGVLGVGRRSGRPFSARDADVLDAFAGLASLALRNAETFTHELTAGARPARLLSHRFGARAVALALRNARSGGAGRGGSARRPRRRPC